METASLPGSDGFFVGDYEGLASAGNDFVAFFAQPHGSDHASIFSRRVKAGGAGVAEALPDSGLRAALTGTAAASLARRKDETGQTRVARDDSPAPAVAAEFDSAPTSEIAEPDDRDALFTALGKGDDVLEPSVGSLPTALDVLAVNWLALR